MDTVHTSFGQHEKQKSSWHSAQNHRSREPTLMCIHIILCMSILASIHSSLYKHCTCLCTHQHSCLCACLHICLCNCFTNLPSDLVQTSRCRCCRHIRWSKQDQSILRLPLHAPSLDILVLTMADRSPARPSAIP